MGYNEAMEKPQSKTRTKGKELAKRKKILIFSGGFLALVVVFAGWQYITIRQDDKRFAAVEQKKHRLAEGLKSELGGVVLASRDKNECFNTEQGPYDNGRLWCQTATIITLKQAVDYQTVARSYIELGRPFGTANALENTLFPKYYINMSEGLTCQLDYNDPDGKYQGGAMSKPFDDSDKPALAIACADRAKAKHYPFVD